MKIRSFALIALSLITISLKAQYGNSPIQNLDLTKINLEQLKFGLKVSPAISWMNIIHNDAFAGGAALKFGLGVTANYEINEYLSAILAINYQNLGGYMADSRSLNNPLANDYFKTNYTAIDVPLGIKLKTREINRYNYYIQGGVATDFILSAKEKIFNASGNGTLSSQDIMLDLTYPTLVGYFAGVGARYNVSSKFKLFAEVNYKNALTTVANGEKYITDNKHLYTDPIQIIPASMEFSFGVEF